MSDLPEQLPHDLVPPADADPRPADLSAPPLVASGFTASSGLDIAPDTTGTGTQYPPSFEQDTKPLFESYLKPPQERIPHLGHLGILFLISLLGLALAAVLAHVAVTYHLYGVRDFTQAATEIHYTLGTEALFYGFTFLGSLIVFPFVWHKSLFAGLQWNGDCARRYAGYLMGTATLCFALAMIDGFFLPGPADAPIDRIFRTPGAAWILFAFGVTLAPFFEELGFRGFLLPALATAYDWIAEKVTHQPRLSLDEEGHPRWSLPAMVTASLVTSVLFAFMHAEQTSYSIGPMLLLVFVSLVLCTARLRLRSLAASVLVHATYNFLLFSFMLIGTGGFKHLDKM
jgi:hypothetical protein